jgi:hypothetical protein
MLNVTEENDLLLIEGRVLNPSKYKQMELCAANPIDRMMNYSGSGLPFPNPFIAFEDTPNYLRISKSGEIRTIFQKPNSYYGFEKQQKINPSIFVVLSQKNADPLYVHFQMEDSLPLKTVYYRKERTGPDFYERKAELLDVASQYTIIRNLERVKVQGKCA